MIATPVTREMLLNVVKVMPAAPQILAQLGELLLDLNSGLNEITELLRRDAGLTRGSSGSRTVRFTTRPRPPRRSSRRWRASGSRRSTD